MEKKITAHEMELFKQGWCFYGNVSIEHWGEPYTNEHLREEYMKKRFKDVLVENFAFDCEGQPLKPHTRAIYIKK